MAFVDDPNKNSQNNEVAGPAPLSNSASTGQPSGDTSSQGSQGGSQPSTIQSGSAPASTNKKAPKASSGMFTNIQKYVDKNKPQAQKMADSSVSDIRATQENIKKQQQDTINKFTTSAQQSGLHDTAARVSDVNQYTTEQANLPLQAPANTTETPEGQRTEGAPVDNRVLMNNTLGSQQVPVVQPSSSSLGDSKFADIINANYTGPKNLTEEGNLYQKALEAANKAGKEGELAQTTQGREQLLRDKFTQGGKQYTKGASQLDNLLMGQQTSQLQEMRDTGKAIGSSQDLMKALTGQAANVVTETAGQVLETKNKAREEFKRVAEARHGQIDSRVGDVIENWDELPAHFRNAMSNPDGTVNLSKVEAATLGVASGEGLYNLSGEDLFGTSQDPNVIADKTKLISKQEQGNLQRLQALSKLARGGDELYNTGEYSDAEKAGTQSAFDALDIKGVRAKLAEAEQGFRDDASKDITGYGRGSKNYKRSLGRSGKATASSSKTGNLKDQLKDIYDFDSTINNEVTDNSKYLNALSSMTNPSNSTGDMSGIDIQDAVGGIEGHTKDSNNNLVDGSLGAVDGVGNLVGGITGEVGNVADAIGDLSSNVLGENNDIAKILNMPTDFASSIANSLSSGISNLSGSLFGSGKKKARQTATREARNNANKDLSNKLNKAYKNSGVKNRVGVQDTAQNAERNQQLMDLLARLDKNNI